MPEPGPIPTIKTPWGSLTPTGDGARGGAEPAPVSVPDHTLLRRIGRGAYGEVWLARNALGLYRAVKVLHRSSFGDDRPFEREFAGMQRFEPVSRSHESQLNILHVGRTADHFYYVMELADDQGHGTAVDEASYTPRTLRSELLFRGRLPVDECLRLGLALTTALEHLHRHGLVHRDIKPSNIVFVNGIPKLADIGLVAQAERTMSFVGTEGYLPPEGPGTVQADLFSLGKVLYEISTGNDRQQFPELPTNVGELPDRAALAEFNEVLVRACAPDVKQRYRTAAEMHADLALLQSGGSVARARSVERRLKFLVRGGAFVTGLAILAGLAFLYQQSQTREARRLADENRALAGEKLNLAERAEANAALARKSEAIARESLYAADIQLAQQALRADNLRLAQSLLQNHVPKPGQPDLRGFEWRYLWQQCRSEELFSLPAHTNNSRVLAFAPDGQRLAVGGYTGGNIRLWDLRLQQEIATLPDTNRIQSLSFSPGGEVLASGSANDVRLWNTVSFQEVHRLTNAAGPAVFSPDGRFLLTRRGPWKLDGPDWNQPKELMVWNTQNWTVAQTATFPASGRSSGSRDLYLQIAVGADASRVAVLVGDTVRIVSCPELNELRILPDKLAGGSRSRPFLALSPDNRTLAIPSPQGFGVRLWDTVENRELRVLPGHADHIFSARFSPDGTLLATGSPDQTTKLWQVATGELLHTFRGQADEVADVAFSPDGALLASLGITEPTVMMWDPRTRPRREVVRRPVFPAGFEPDGGLVSFLVPGLRPAVLDPASHEIAATTGPRTREDIGYGIYPRSLSSDGRLHGLWLLDEQRLEVWDRNSRELLCSVPAVAPMVSFDSGRNLATTYTTNAAGQLCLAIWQLPQGSLKWLWVDSSGSGLMVSSNECYLSTQDATHFHLWRVEGGDLAPVLKFPSRDGSLSAEVSPDGRWLATASGDITLRALPSAEVVGVLKGHMRKAVLLAFSPDSRTLASMADDRTVRLWHLATQRELLRFQAPSEDRGPYFLEFSPDGRGLGTMRIDEEGRITWLHFAPSLAEIAVTEGQDYRALAGRDPATWFAVAKSLQRLNRGEEALQACSEVLQLTEAREQLAWLHTKVRRQRAETLRQLGRLNEAGAENCALRGIPARDPVTPPGAIDLSAFYNASPAASWHGVGNDLSELPLGIQSLAGTRFDLRGVIQLYAPNDSSPLGLPQVEAIPIRRRLNRLQFLCGAQRSGVPSGSLVGRFVVHFADGHSEEVPLRYNVNITDWWTQPTAATELPDAVTAWEGSNAGSRGMGMRTRLFKLTWENPTSAVEVTHVDFVATHQGIDPFLVALTAE